MNAKKMQAEIEEMLLRNLSILDGEPRAQGETLLRASDVRDMLKSCAANLAQLYAHRAVEETELEDAR